MTKHWGYQLIDGLELSSIDDAKSALMSREAAEFATLLAREANDADIASEDDSPEDGFERIVAGRRVDLSGAIACARVACNVEKVDGLLAEVWHYFDKIVVEGLSPHAFLSAVSEDDEWTDDAIEMVIHHLELLFHIREIGAEPFLDFRTKPYRFCIDHWHQHAQALGLPSPADESEANRVIEYLLQEGEFEVHDNRTKEGAEPYLNFFSHPDFDGLALGIPSSEPLSGQIMARKVYDSYSMAAVSDLALARQLESPLVSPIDRVIHTRRGNQSTRFEDKIALSVRFPVLVGVPLADLLHLRSEYQGEFQRFRMALRTAINEVLATSDTEIDAKKAARRVWRDYLEPSLADVEVKLSASRKSMYSKVGHNVIVGAAQVGLGLMTHVPLLIGSGLATAGASIAHLNKYADERRDIGLSDVQFLWRAVQPHRHN